MESGKTADGQQRKEKERMQCANSKRGHSVGGTADAGEAFSPLRNSDMLNRGKRNEAKGGGRQERDSKAEHGLRDGIDQAGHTCRPLSFLTDFGLNSDACHSSSRSYATK